MADPGRLQELLIRGRKVWLRSASNPDRKTKWSAVLAESPNGEGLVSLDTTLPNRLIGRALESHALPELSGWSMVRREVPLGRSRLDFLLAREDGVQMALEVKSVTLVEEGIGLFPDAITARGARHLRELMEISSDPGWEGAVLFVLQRPDALEIRAAERIDPVFARTLLEAKKAGVRVLGRRCHVFPDRVELGDAVPAQVG